MEEPFGLGPPEQRALAPLAEDAGAEFVLDEARRVRADDHIVELAPGPALSYDHLVVAIGGRFRPTYEGVITFPSREPVKAESWSNAGAARATIGSRSSSRPESNWSLPLYEIALMTERRVRELGDKVRSGS